MGLGLISLYLWGLCSLHSWKYMVWEHLGISHVDIKLYLEGGPSGLGPEGCLLLWGGLRVSSPGKGTCVSCACEHASIRPASGTVGSPRDDFHSLMQSDRKCCSAPEGELTTAPLAS